jgi:hypothetical protein
VYETQVIVNSENLSVAKKPHSVVSRAAADLCAMDNSRSEINNLNGLSSAAECGRESQADYFLVLLGLLGL